MTTLAEEFAAIERAMQRCPEPDVVFDARPFRAESVTKAREAWRGRAVVEYRSTTIFAALAAQLVEARARCETTAVMLRMAQDEARHGARCMRVVRALGGDEKSTEFPEEMSVVPLARHAGVSVQERVLRNVIYTTCLSEMVAVAQLADTLESTTEPYLREQTRQLLADEVLHGQFGFLYLAEQRALLARAPDLVAGLERYLRHAFAILETELVPTNLEVRATDEERALGLTDAKRRREIFYAAMEEAIVPGLEERGLDAGKSWRTRSRLD